MKIYPIALHFAKEDQHFAKYFKNPQNIAQMYGHSAKVAKFCQIWSHYLSETAFPFAIIKYNIIGDTYFHEGVLIG